MATEQEILEKLKTFKNQEDIYETLLTIVIHNLKVSDVIDKLSHQLSLISNIKSSTKRKHANDRVYFLKLFFSEKIDINEIINGIYLVNDTVNEFILPQNWLVILKEYEIKNYMFKYGMKFDIDYLKNLFLDNVFYDVIYLKNVDLTHYRINSTKKKHIFYKSSKNNNLYEYAQKNIKPNDFCFIYGISSLIKGHEKTISNLLKNSIIVNKNLNGDIDNEILTQINEYNMKKNHEKLKYVFENLTNDKIMHKFVFGKDISEKLENCEIETLFCSNSKFEVLKELFDLKKIRTIIIEPIVKNDIGDDLYKYDQNIGITYY